jgi:DNA-directed RNA polymerase specialized sigma24 family protein
VVGETGVDSGVGHFQQAFRVGRFAAERVRAGHRSAIKSDRAEASHRLLFGLPKEQREKLTQAFFDGFGRSQITTRLGQPRAAIAWRTFLPFIERTEFS